MPIAPIPSMVGEKARLDIKRLHLGQLFRTDDLAVNRDCALSCQSCRRGVIDQSLHRFVTVDVHKDLPIIRTSIGQLSLKQA